MYDLDVLSGKPISPKRQLEQEKRIRREIANSNERRRMQSINAGFNSLRTMLPHHDGEKLSKAAILQHTAEYIYQLEQEKTKLLTQNTQMKRLGAVDMDDTPDMLPKRVKLEPMDSPSKLSAGILSGSAGESDSSDEGVHCSSPRSGQRPTNGTEPGLEELRNELIECRKILDRERRLRMQLEEQVRNLEAQLYPERIKEIAHQVQMQFHSHEVVQQPQQEEEVAVASVVNDEIVAETIEIETHSGSGSMSIQPTTIVTVVQTQSNVTSSPSSPTRRAIIDVPQDLSSKGISISSANGISLGSSSLTASKAPVKSFTAQPAAIALPIDVPFIGDTNTSTTNSGSATVTIEVIGSTAGTTKYQATGNVSSTSRQNLETIVEAIRHLEGDHLFRDDDAATTVVVKEVTVADDEMTDEGTSEDIEVEAQNSTLRTVLTVSPEEMGAIRHQVIQCLPISSQSRPGVIVANHA